MTSRLNTLAYSMLGSIEDAEEVVQEAHLKLHEQAFQPENTEAYLFRLVSNLCIDRLRRLRTQRKAYFGPWLPDPMQEDAFETVELAQQLSIGFMHLLEQLTPAERISYVLREAFDYSHSEIADVLRISPANARQRNRRARLRLQDKDPHQTFPDDQCKALLKNLLGVYCYR